MTKGEVPTMAGHEQAADTAAEQQQVAQEQSAPVAEENGAQEAQARQMTAEAVAAAVAAEEAATAEQAPVEMASVEMPAPVKAAEVDEDADKKEKKGEQQDAQADADAAPVDLAMLPEVEMLDAIAAADGARAMPSAEGEAGASLLSDEGGFLIPLLAVAAVGLGIAVAVGGGDDDDLPPAPPPPPPPPANQAPVISSGATADADENSAVEDVVYTATATDADGDDITYSISGTDAASFTIDPDTGEVRFVASPDFETKASYTFTVTATDEDGATDTQDVTVTVNDVVEGGPPVFSSEAEFTVEENMDVTTAVFTPAATDPDGGEVTFTLTGEDADMFEIDAETGEVRFIASPDFETQAEYNVTVVATDEDGETTEQDVTVTVTDVLEEGPTEVLLDESDDDNNPNTAVEIDASDDDYLFVEDEDLASSTIITGFGEGDVIEFGEGVVVSFSTSADDANDLQIIVNNGGVVSEIILDDVLADDAGLIFDEATAEAEVGFDFFQAATVEVPAPAADTFA